MFKFFEKANEYETQQFAFKFTFNGEMIDGQGWYNPNSIEGGYERAYQIQKYLQKMFPHREFLVTTRKKGDKGLCVESFDLMSYSKYRNNPIRAYLPVWDDDVKSAVFKIW